MWAIALLSCRLCPPAIAISIANQAPFTVSATPRHSRPRKNINYDYEIEDEFEIQVHNEETDNQLTWNQSEIVDSDDQPKISGSAVLLALQKATANKTSKKIKKKTKIIKHKQEKGDGIPDYSDVKPLCIKSNWKDRLDELETQLHQLIHNS